MGYADDDETVDSLAAAIAPIVARAVRLRETSNLVGQGILDRAIHCLEKAVEDLRDWRNFRRQFPEDRGEGCP